MAVNGRNLHDARRILQGMIVYSSKTVDGVSVKRGTHDSRFDHPARVYEINGQIVEGYNQAAEELLRAWESLPKTGTKAMELRAKYKATPSKRDMIFIGDWGAPHSGAGSFYAPRDRSSQVASVYRAIEENDDSREAFNCLVNAGGVFIRD